MIDPLDFEKRPFLTMLSRKRRYTAFVIFAERFAQLTWRTISWLAFFTGLWMMQIASVVGEFGPVLLNIAFFLGLFYFTRKDLRHLRWPSHNEIDRRLETSSVLKHRPISALEDKLVNSKKIPTRELWQKNQDEALQKIKSLKVPVPSAFLPASDIMAFRFLCALVFIVGLIAAGPQWQDRIAYGLFPFSFQQENAQKTSNITLWITPPEYTAKEQIILQGKIKSVDPVKIPEGSIIKVRINEGFTQPVLHISEQEMPLEKLSENSWGLEANILDGNSIIVKQWPLTKVNLPYEFIIDTPPEITVTGAPETLQKGETKLGIEVFDDYGVIDLSLKMKLDVDLENDEPLGSPYEEMRAVMSPANTKLEIAPVYDLSWHPWSGLPVKIELEAVDYVGQTNKAAPLHMSLPERTFNHPIAQKLISFRKRLIWTPEEAAENVAYDLETILQDPGLFQYDFITFLNIRSASSRLIYRTNTNDIIRVIELLWDTALRVEEGNLSLAARDLRDAQRNLEQALRNPNSTDQDIAKAMQELREAMAEYFQEMYRELQKRMAENGQQMQMPPEMFMNMIQPEDMASFLDKLQAEALSGDRDSAKELLSQLQQFMDMLDPSMDMAMPPQMEFMMEGINELQELIEKQQALLDQTQTQANRMNGQTQQDYPEFTPFDKDVMEKWGMGNMPPPPQNDERQKNAKPHPVDTQDNKIEQESLRFILGQLMLETDEQLGEIPEKMQSAEQEMRNSAEQLGGNRPDLSIPHQELAIAYLQDAMKDMAEQMQQMMQNMTLMSFGGMPPMDPLGRPIQEGESPGLFPGSRVEIPDESERKRVQEILKILRKRSGEISRPDYELEYYRRLMKKF